MSKLLFFAFALFVGVISTSAQLSVKVESTEQLDKKAIIKLSLKNNFPEKVESARAQIFLMDDKGSVVGQGTKWIIGGTKDKPALDPGASTNYNFVVETDRPFTKTKVGFSRIILEGGKVADAPKSFEIAP